MALIRAVRPPPIKPTTKLLRQLMHRYGLTRVRVARLMRRSVKAVDLYLLPDESPNKRQIPMTVWELLLMKIQAIYHPDEDVEINL